MLIFSVVRFRLTYRVGFMFANTGVKRANIDVLESLLLFSLTSKAIFIALHFPLDKASLGSMRSQNGYRLSIFFVLFIILHVSIGFMLPYVLFFIAHFLSDFSYTFKSTFVSIPLTGLI